MGASGRGRAVAQAWRGGAAAAMAAGTTLLLCVAALGAAAAGAGARAAWPCDGLLANATPWAAPSVWWEAGGGYFAQLRSNDGALQLRSVLRLHPLAQRDAERSACAPGGGPAAQVCVALEDTTAYTRDGEQENAAWVTLHADPLQPVAVVEVDADCWERERSSLSRCRPCVLAPAPLRQLPLFRFSPLTRAFWAALHADALPPSAGARRPWLRRLNMQANAERSARAEWVRLARLPTLRGLELTGNAWGEGEGAQPLQLPPLPQLGELRLHHNRLAALPEDFLSKSPLLEMLILARNSLTRLPQSITNLKMLRLLDVTNPQPLGQSFSVVYIAQLPNLRILGLENQKLVGNVMPILFMPSLMFLNMSGCGLTNVNNTRNSSLTTDLQVLDLSYNQLEVLGNGVLSRFPKLGRLLLNGNKLRVLGDENKELTSLAKLDYLDISQNHLKTFPQFQPDSQLKTFIAHDNTLEGFNENFWESFPKLEILDLSNNHLTEAPALTNQEHLRNLDLSNNEIKVVYDQRFGQMTNLKSIDLSNNLLSYLHSDALKNFADLKTIDLSHNRLWHVSLVSESLEFADISYNLLRNMPTLETPSLYHLSLKQNLIPSVNFSSVNASSLRELDISWNKIREADLGNLTFDEVDLSHNILKRMPNNSFGTQTLKVDDILNGEESEEESSSELWDSWFIWTLGGIGALAVITAILLVGVAILVRKLMKRNEPLVLSPTCRSPSPESFNEPVAIRFK